MKKVLFIASLLAIVAQSCTKEDSQNVVAEQKTTIEVVADLGDETRTYYDGDNIKWAKSGEQLNIIYYADDNSSSRRQTATHTDYTIDAEGRILFTADFTTTDGATSYTLGAFYPYAYKSTTSSISLTVPQMQTPTADSYDPATDILVSKEPVTIEGTPESVKFTFARMVAFAKMTLKGIGAGETIEKVTFYSSAKPAGAVEFKVHEAATVENAKWYNNYEEITITRENWVATGEDVVWMTTVPTDLSGTDFTVTVVTDKYTYTKSVDLTDKTLTFERGDVAIFTVNDLQRQEKPKAYKLLTDINELNAGDQIVIATKASASSTAKMLATTATGSSLKHTSSMTISDGPVILPENLPSDAAVFDVENGVTAGTFALKEVTMGYLYGVYDPDAWSNTLSFKAEKDASASWDISLTSTYTAWIGTYEYDGAESMRYVNNYSYSSKFNFNGSTSNVYIYYIDGESSDEGGEEPATTPLTTPVVTAAASGDVVTVTWEAVAGAANYTVTCGEATTTVDTTTATFEGVAAGTYEVTVVANPADATINTASEAGTASVTVEAAPAGETKSVEIAFPIEGAASGNSVGTIYEGDLLISSTGSWRTDSADGRDCIYIGRTTSNELRIEAQNDKTITKVTLTAPVGYLVDLKAKEYDGYTTQTFASVTEAVWTGECASRIVWTAAGNSHSNIASIVVEYK